MLPEGEGKGPERRVAQGYSNSLSWTQWCHLPCPFFPISVLNPPVISILPDGLLRRLRAWYFDIFAAIESIQSIPILQSWLRALDSVYRETDDQGIISHLCPSPWVRSQVILTLVRFQMQLHRYNWTVHLEIPSLLYLLRELGTNRVKSLISRGHLYIMTWHQLNTVWSSSTSTPKKKVASNYVTVNFLLMFKW